MDKRKKWLLSTPLLVDKREKTFNKDIGFLNSRIQIKLTYSGFISTAKTIPRDTGEKWDRTVLFLSSSQTEVCARNRPDQTVPSWKRLWSDSNALDILCALENTCFPDQTHLRSNVLLIRLTCVRNLFWSDSVALEMLSALKASSARL